MIHLIIEYTLEPLKARIETLKEWGTKAQQVMRWVALIVAFILYILLLKYLKVLYLKGIRLNAILRTVNETKRMLASLYELDHQLAADLEELYAYSDSDTIF